MRERARRRKTWGSFLANRWVVSSGGGGAHGPGFGRLCGSGVLSCGGGGGGTGQLTGWANSIKAMDGGRKEGMKEGWKE